MIDVETIERLHGEIMKSHFLDGQEKDFFS